MTILLLIAVTLFGAVNAIGIAHSKLPGATSIRVTGEGVELRFKSDRAERWSWRGSGRRFLLLDFSEDPAAHFFRYNRYLVGPRFYSIRTYLTQEALDAVLAQARVSAQEVLEVPQTFWAMGIRKKWMVQCG